MEAQALSWADRAARVLAGGCDSPVRSGASIGVPMFVQTAARDAYAFDESGRRYVDYVMAYGPLLFGHTHPQLTTTLDDLATDGFVWGSTHPAEIRLAERIRSHLGAMERLRFVTTGTEAIMSAVRVARAFTRRNLIVKFGGNYHGHSDFALPSAGASAESAGSPEGIPGATKRDVAVARYNDLDSLDAVLRNRKDVAAILVEPICANMGYVAPAPGFLQGLRERCDRVGAVLIFDEVITWLRLGLGGAQSRMRVPPDLVAVGKILGGGVPIAAFGGRAEIMEVLAPSGGVFTGGTHAGNPFCVSMAHRVLDLLENHPELYANVSELGRRLASGIRRILLQRGLDYAVVQDESIVDFKFRSGRESRNFDDALAADSIRYARYYRAMLRRGILLPPSQNEVMFLSFAHTVRDVDETLAAIAESVAA